MLRGADIVLAKVLIAGLYHFGKGYWKRGKANNINIIITTIIIILREADRELFSIVRFYYPKLLNKSECYKLNGLN